MAKVKIISSLEKAFADMRITGFRPLGELTLLKGESGAFQLLCECTPEDTHGVLRMLYTLEVVGELSEYVTVREVRHLPVTTPLYPQDDDAQYLRKEPGLFPDLLMPLRNGGKVVARTTALSSYWVDIDLPADAKATDGSLLTFRLTPEYGEPTQASITIEVLDALLPEQTMYFTQWFHCDCLANYYRVEPWSEEHWRIVENFARVAVKNGINLLLTPVFTPPLDTYVGGERTTVQLVGVSKTAGEYSFDFSLLDRWVDMCNRVGIKYLEISHLFTQWGAEHAPKIMATVDGEYKRIFGWDTDASGEEYSAFLRRFLTEFIAHMKNRGDDKRCFYHISDEPNSDHIEQYKADKAIVGDLLSDYTIMDALSRIEFYTSGICETPIPATNHVHTFIDAKVPNLWTYYCTSQHLAVSNRFVAMPSWRTRSIGMHLYKYDIVGFLQWGYNFYNTQYSRDDIDPFTELSCDGSFPAGDAFSVYPAPDGTAYESLRIIVFKHALNDVSAMKLCESLYSKEEVVAEMEKVLGEEITFWRCALSAKEMENVRDAVNRMIREKLVK